MRCTVPLAALSLLSVAACTTKSASRQADTAAPATATLAGAPSSLNAAEVRQKLDSIYPRFADALTKADTAAAAGAYADDAILLAPSAKAAHGHDAIAKTFAGMFSAMKVTSFKGTTEDIITAGDYAIETGAYDMAVQPKSGKAAHDVGKYLTVWKKQPDGSLKMVRDIFNSDGAMK